MRRAALAVLVLSLVLPASGCAICCDQACDLLFPGSGMTLDQKAEMDRQNANFAWREQLQQSEKDRPSNIR